MSVGTKASNSTDLNMPKMYEELAPWWPLLSSPAEYEEEAGERLFTRADWLRLLSDAGFEPRPVPFEHSELDPGSHEVFVAQRSPRRTAAFDCRGKRYSWARRRRRLF